MTDTRVTPLVPSPGHFIDLAGWKRREHFELFRGYAKPFFSVCAELDATVLRESCSAPDGPLFSLATIFLALRCANETESFRMRVRGDGVWVHDRVSIGPTILRTDETFGFARLDPAENLGDFMRLNASELARARKVGPLSGMHPDDDMIYQSTLPWIRFTGFSNAMAGNGDSIPRVVFGKCSKDGARWRLPVGLEVHHAVVDGIDAGRYLERLELSMGSNVA
ncbi:MAG: CatA-like O-acetyltransferase [Gemmatimonadaceae bacterium]